MEIIKLQNQNWWKWGLDYDQARNQEYAQHFSYWYHPKTHIQTWYMI